MKEQIARSTNNGSETIACVIFDIDGTLTRTNDLIFESFNHVSEKFVGKRMSHQEIVALFGPPEEGGLARVVPSDDVDEAMDELCRFYRDHHEDLAALHPGVEDILRYLKSHRVKLAIFTGKGKRTTGITLDALNISSYFDLIVSGSDVVNHKPHHEGIAKVLDHFSLLPDTVLMVGDSAGDVKASRAAGVKVAAVVWDSYDRESVLRANADFVFYSVDELYDWLKRNIN